MKNENSYKIKITKNGPYIVTGGVPLAEKIIVPKGREYEFQPGRALQQREMYSLCRCGKSREKPFCDATHVMVKYIAK